MGEPWSKLAFTLGRDLGRDKKPRGGAYARSAALAAAANGEDRGGPAKGLKAFVRFDAFPVRQAALDGLRKCGPAARETIREMLDDPAFSDDATKGIEQAKPVVAKLLRSGAAPLREVEKRSMDGRLVPGHQPRLRRGLEAREGSERE